MDARLKKNKKSPRADERIDERIQSHYISAVPAGVALLPRSAGGKFVVIRWDVIERAWREGWKRNVQFLKEKLTVIRDRPLSLFEPAWRIDSFALNRWFAVLRTVSGVVFIGAIVFLRYLGVLNFNDTLFVYGVLQFYILTNIFWLYIFRGRERPLLLHVQLALNLAILSVGQYVSGGIHSPFIFVYIVEIISAAFISTFAVMGALGSALLFAALLSYLENIGIIIPMYMYGEYAAFQSGGIARLVFFAATAIIVAFQSSYYISRMRKKDAEISLLRDTFLATAAHQIKSPMTAEAFLVESLLGDKDLTPGQRRLIRGINSTLRTTREFVQDFLSLSRIEEAHSRAYQKDEVALLPFLRDAVHGAEIVSTEKKARVSWNIHKSLECIKVKTYSSMFRQIIQNIVANAIHYSPQNGIIEMAVMLGDGEIVISCRDEGIGIVAGDQEYIFQPFFRSENAKKIAGGSGLGLYIVKKLADECGYRVWFTSEENKGTAFFVAIPASAKSG